MTASTKKNTKATAGKTTGGVTKKQYKHLFVAEPKSFSIGGSVLPKKYLNLYRFVKWPQNVRIQRQKRVLMKRLKVPPSLNQFTKCANRELARQALQFLSNYKPETREAKKQRLRAEAEKKAKGEAVEVSKGPAALKFGLNEVVKAIERKTARLVVMAHDVDPIELIVYLPALCKKMDVPYMIIKSQDRLGKLVYQPTASCVALTEVRKEDRDAFNQLVSSVRGAFNERFSELTRNWGGGQVSRRSLQARRKTLA